MSNSIEGKIVVITGASSGMEQAAARHLEPLLPLRILLPGLEKVARVHSLSLFAY